MAHVVFAWELGGAYGHLGQMLPVAHELRRRGHRVDFVIRELTEAQRLLGPSGFRWYQAPLWTGRVLGLSEPLSHAEMLMRLGFLNPQALLGVCRAWRHLFELLAPDLVVFDYAPTAQLASRGLPFPGLSLATGFYVPPAVDPLPPFRWWQPAPTGRLVDSQRQVQMVANQVLHELGAPLVASLREVLGCPTTLFTTLAELDHFAGRGPADFVGPMFSIGRAQPVAWPDGAGPRLFGYLKPDFSHLEPLLDALARLPAVALVHVPGAARRLVERYSAGPLRVLPQQLDIDQMRAECDWGVLHGGVGTASALLLAGKPLLLAPMHTEQQMFSRSLEKAGAAAVLPDGAAGQYPRLLKRALGDTALPAAAQAFAARHAGHDPAQTVLVVADRCEALLPAGKAGG